MRRLREFFNTTAGKIVATVLVLAGIVVLIHSAKSSLGNGDAIALSRDRVYIDATTGKPFNFELKIGDSGIIPVQAPSGGRTGYPAEQCYWTADGQIKSEPTYVLLSKFAGRSGPTFCPDCGRLVVEHNPPPILNGKPPPTEEEYKRLRQKMTPQE
jgi:hypothetical protein